MVVHVSGQLQKNVLSQSYTFVPDLFNMDNIARGKGDYIWSPSLMLEWRNIIPVFFDPRHVYFHKNENKIIWCKLFGEKQCYPIR